MCAPAAMSGTRPPRSFPASTTPLRGLAGPSGIPEVSSGIPSPPQSPPLAAMHTSKTTRARRGGAAFTITEQCERLFCETLRSVFLGEGNQARQDSLVMGMHNKHQVNDYGFEVRCVMDSPSPEMEGAGFKNGLVGDWIEVWDYVGGNRFRGFVAEKGEEKAMFVFFDQSVIGGDLKAGLMALLELCDVSHFSCSRLVACLDRDTDTRVSDVLAKDLGWIGFQLTTLEDFTRDDEITSKKWLFMDMEV